jgi:S1-C subfamily serine protease
LNNKKKVIPFTKTKDVAKKSSKWKVSLGVMPDYTFDGVGLRIDGVSEGRPASLASLESGDVIIQMGEMKIIDIYDYMKALSKLKKGDKLDVKVLRNGSEVIKELNF